MSLQLNDPDSTPGLEAKSWPNGVVTLSTDDGGTITLGMDDFLILAMYMLTNTDLVEDDPRIGFLKMVSRLTKLEGFNKAIDKTSTSERLGFP